MERKIKYCAVGVLCLSLVFFFGSLSFCQEANQTAPATPTALETPATPATPTAPADETSEPEDSWLWGDVVSVDKDAGKITLKYIDYETDSEKEVSVYASPETTYENVTGLAEIKTADTVSVDYTTAADGKMMARHISVEKLEGVPEEADTTEAPAAASNETEVPEY